MSSYYRIIAGKRYDRSLLDRADQSIKGKGDGRISLQDMQKLYELAHDGKVLTTIESNTLLFIKDKYPVTTSAADWLLDQKLAVADPVEAAIRIVRDQFGFPNVTIDMQEQEIDNQSKIPSTIDFPDALTAALATIDDSRQWTGFLLQNTFWPNDDAIPDQLYLLELIELWRSKTLQNASIFLVQDNFQTLPSDQIKYPVPRDYHSTKDYWIFGFRTQAYSDYVFFAFIHRNNTWDRHLKAFFSGDFHLSERVELAIGEIVGAPGLEIAFDVSKINEQYTLYNNALEFEAVAYYSLMFGLSNGESSISFRDRANNEFWHDFDDPESFDRIIRRFLNNSRLHLVPPPDKLDSLPLQLPAWVGENIPTWWYFVVEPLENLGYYVLLNMDRQQLDNYATAWSDTYEIPQNLTTAQQIDTVIRTEFALDEIKIDIPVEELEKQHSQYDPDWRTPITVIRQVINTLRDDYLHPTTFYNEVLEMLEHESDGIGEDLVTEDELEEAIDRHLEASTLYLAPISFFDPHAELPSHFVRPANILPVEEYYMFQLHAPSLGKRFIINIPRYPGYESRPVNYAIES